MERERVNLTGNREHERTLQRTMENEIHELQLKNGELKAKAKERDNLQQSIATFKREIESLQDRIKVQILSPAPSTFLTIENIQRRSIRRFKMMKSLFDE